jgi:hypothetical protein
VAAQDKNQQFMKDLSMNIPPAEMRELDPSGRPIPVNISLADHREEDPSNAQVVCVCVCVVCVGLCVWGCVCVCVWILADHREEDASTAQVPSPLSLSLSLTTYTHKYINAYIGIQCVCMYSERYLENSLLPPVVRSPRQKRSHW